MTMNAAKTKRAESGNAESISLAFEARGDSAKLVSLLALAAAAAAIPQSGKADIIFTDLSSNPVTVGNNTNSSFLVDTLPGTAQLGVFAFPKPSPGATVTNWITAKRVG